MNFIEKMIVITVQDDPADMYAVRALVTGPFAIARNPAARAWDVYHVPTGCLVSFLQRLTRPQAERLILALVALDVDWQSPQHANYQTPLYHQAFRAKWLSYRSLTPDN